MTNQASDPRTIAELLDARAEDDHAALVFEGTTWTWSALVAEARRRAALLSTMRVDGPFHVGVLLDNVPEYVFMLAAAGMSGAVIVGINPTRRGEALAQDIRNTDCQILVTDSDHRALLGDLELGVGVDRLLEVDTPAFQARLSVLPDRSPIERPDPQSLFVLMFTSGSSGAPKAVRMTHERAVRASNSLLCTRDDIPYCAMPLYHGNALNACLFPAMRVGATIALRRRFSASDFIEDVRANHCTYFSAIGRVLNYILATPPAPNDHDNQLKLVLGPESSSADMKAFEERFGCPVFAGYGSSENAIMLLPAPRSAQGALGTAPPGDDVVVVNAETGVECPTARFDEHGALVNAEVAIGEIVGRNVLGRFEGYYNNAVADDERRRNGWYWSGDLAYQDEHGVFWFAGRTADWIRVDGENFGTAPVERVLERFAPFRSVAVYGVPDDRNAEDQVMASVELAEPQAFDPTAFREFLDVQPDLGTKWAPRFIRVVDRLPVTATDKIDKKPLRSEAWNTTDEVWWRPDRRHKDFLPFTTSDRAALNDSLKSNRRTLVAPE